MPGMQMPGMVTPATNDGWRAGLMSMHPQNFLASDRGSCGFGHERASPTPRRLPMLMTTRGAWMLMFHANVFVVDQQQSRRARRATNSSRPTGSWAWRSARLGRGVFTAARHAEPRARDHHRPRYPLLFQQGETAYGNPIADGQHPHNFFMELAALYDLKLGATRPALVLFRAGGRSGHRTDGVSASRIRRPKIPLATLGHHQEDSTHIADDVVTVGLTYRIVRIEASGFHGASRARIAGTSIRVQSTPGRRA